MKTIKKLVIGACLAAGLACLIPTGSSVNAKSYMPKVVEQTGTYYLRNDGVIITNGVTYNYVGWHSGKNNYPVAVHINTHETVSTADDTIQAFRFLKGDDTDWHFPW